MTTQLTHIFFLLAIASDTAWAFQNAQAASEAARLEFFESRIRPMLVEHCYECHSVKSGKSKGGLQLDSKAGWQLGGDSGPAIVPGKPDESPVVQAISHSGEMSEMPPRSRLSTQIVNDFRRWISDGAFDPRVDAGTSHLRKREFVNIEEGGKFWAFQPRRSFAEEQSIDSLVMPQARRAANDTLIRRLFLDLIGLPPTVDERQAFLRSFHEKSPQAAITTVVDQLMSRREFGEKWARHWLDVVRYADSNGGDFNLTFHEAWRYRNYVIDAFNNDMPYDQFLREQIAGDLLPFENPEQRNRQLIATGFLMLGSKMLTERNKEKMHLDIADEQVDTIGRAVMGLTLGCARCHDHKFDPIPTADYYAMAGILHSTRTADRVLMDNVNVTGWTETNLEMDKATEAQFAVYQAKLEQLKGKVQQKRDQLARKPEQRFRFVVDDSQARTSGPWRKSTHRPNFIGDYYLATDKGKGPYSIKWTAQLPRPGEYELRVSFAGGVGLAKTAEYQVAHAGGETHVTVDQTSQPVVRKLWQPIGRFTFEDVAEVRLTDHKANGHVIADAIQLVHVDDLERDAASGPSPDIELKSLEDELSKLEAGAPVAPKAMAAQDNTTQRMGDLHIRIRGESRNIGPKASRGFLRVASAPGADSAVIADAQSGRRELADWITRSNHPLTARVMVNRIWQHLFGRGIVATSDNFGARGAVPSHPELLDHLAENFIKRGWSLKTLIREIVLSQTYQQAVAPAAADDPENPRWQRQNRRPAPAETIRDSILAIADKLDRKPHKSAVSQLDMYAITTEGSRHPSLSKTDQLRQRSIYLPVVRGAVPSSLAVFDFPNPDLVTGQRDITTVPAQALFMMNSVFVREMAQAVALRFADADQSIDDIVGQLYQRILVRDAGAQDIQVAKGYFDKLRAEGQSQQQAISSYVQTLFSTAEFRFIE